MGSGYSSNIKVELYEWKSAQYPEENALTFTLSSDKTRYSVFRLSVNPERVVCRFADFLCNEHPARLTLEITAARDKSNNLYTFRAVKAIADGSILRREGLYNDFLSNCENKWCRYGVTRRKYVQFSGSESEERLGWDVSHEYMVSYLTDIRYYVCIYLHAEKGLSTLLCGPYICKGVFTKDITGSVLARTYQAKQEPLPRVMSEIVESEFEGKEYMIYPQMIFSEWNGNSGTQPDSGHIRGPGGHSKYTKCPIHMTYVENNYSKGGADFKCPICSHQT